MRIKFLLLFGLVVTIGIATATAVESSSKDDKKESVKSVTEATKQKDATKKRETEKTLVAGESRQSKDLKSGAPGENRGKRTLYDFENAGNLYADVASRRVGYEENRGAGSYYPQTGFYNGQSAIAQFPGSYLTGYSPYPQYLEAPEPIIEIIIKDANETLAEEPPQPIITKKKKKKEKVHVFYVNYKKDQNNKLHLETPIASLNNDDNSDDEEEEEEEEIIQYPVTPLPPLKTTTLRTIIHPDSEKYHSNSGIHVSFGAEDKSQFGHILEEHDAESIQRQVVALPVGSGIKGNDNFLANTRADYGRDSGFGRAPVSNLLFNSGINSYHHQQQQQQQQQQHQQSATHHFQSQQQLPTQHTSNYFRPPAALVGPPPPPSPPQQQQQQKPALQQHQYFNAKPQQQTQHHRPNYTPQTNTQSIFSKLLQQSQYYVNHNQQYSQPQPSQQQQQYYKPSAAPTKQVPFFPTVPPKTQELPSRQSPVAYQPIKFRPTPAPAPPIKPVPIPAKLDNSNYQPQQHRYQQPQSQPQHQHQHQQQQQQLQLKQPSQNQAPFQFNRQPQFVQQPVFSVQSPTPKTTDYYQSQQQHHQQQHQQQQQTQQKTQVNKYQTQPAASSVNPNAALHALHNYFDIQPSRETELLKSIPKFEQHITETVQNPVGQQQYTFSSNSNQVIHDIPAPNLGPTVQPQVQQQQPLNGHYNTATQNQLHHQQQQQQFTNFVTTSQTVNNNQYLVVPSSTSAPVFAESTLGQKVMVVTPMPVTAYNQYQYNTNINTEPVVQVHSQSVAPQNQIQQPRQSASNQIASTLPNDNSPYSVSTYHQDVFKELQQRTQQNQQEIQHSRPASDKTYVPQPSASAALASSSKVETTTATPTSTTSNGKASQTLLQLPDEVPDDLRQQLFSSGILNNAQISVLDYDKVGDIALENLPAEHLQHFYGAGGGAQIAETNKVLTVVKPNGDKVALSEKDIERVKQSNSLPQKQNLDVKVVRFDPQTGKNISEKYLKSDATVVPPVDLADRQYNRYLPLKLNGAQFPIPDSEELIGKKIVSVVVLAPVEAPQQSSENEARSVDTKEVKFLSGELIKTLVKKPTKENFKRWLEKEARTDLEMQSVVLLVAKSSEDAEQEIFMYDISTGEVNKLNGELSSTFVNVAEENASSEDLEHAATLDPSSLEAMMHRRRR